MTKQSQEDKKCQGVCLLYYVSSVVIFLLLLIIVLSFIITGDAILMGRQSGSKISFNREDEPLAAWLLFFAELCFFSFIVMWSLARAREEQEQTRDS